MVSEETISPEDLDLLLVTDDVEAAMAHIREKAVTGFGLTTRQRPHPWTVLGER
jgi:hypothetical protein